MDQSTMVAPLRSNEQRDEALKKANDVRIMRAQLKREIKAGNADVALLLREPPDFIEKMKVYDLVISAPKFGVAKTAQLFRDCRVSSAKTVGGLSDRQREELAKAFESRRAFIGTT